MAPPIVDANDTTVFINSPISAANLFSAIDLDDEIVSYTFWDFHSKPDSGQFMMDGVAFDNGMPLTIAAADLDRLQYIGSPRIGWERFSVVARDTVGNFSAPAIGKVFSVRTNTSQPHVAQPNFSILANEVVPARSFINGFDPDGYPLTHFRISEQAKVRWVKSVNDVVTVVVHEHNFKSGDKVTLTGADQAAFNTTANVAVVNEHIFKFIVPGLGTQTATGTVLAAAEDLGYFELDGIRKDYTRPFIVSAEQLDRLVYKSTGPNEQETLYVQGYDGAEWSFEKRGLAVTNINANRPVVQFGNVRTPAQHMFPLEDTFVVTDADQSTIKDYYFLNTSPHAVNGDLVFKGEVMPRVEWFKVAADEIDQLFFTTNRVGFEQQIRVFVNDGKHNSAPGTLLINSDKPIIRPEIDVVSDPVVAEQLDTISAGRMFTKIDLGQDHELYEAFDPTTDRASGVLRDIDTPLESGVIHQMSADDFYGRLNFYTGDFYDRDIDPVYARANNDGMWSAWEKVEVRTEPEFEDALRTGLTWADTLPTNSRGKVEIPYSFMQSFPNYDTGEATDDGGDPPLERFSVFNERQRINTRFAFDSLEKFANVKMVEVADSESNLFGGIGGVMRFGNYGVPFPESSAAAFAFFPVATFGQGVGQPSAGDAWFNRLNFLGGPVGPNMDFELQTWGHKVFLHEIGHALGLKHPHDGVPRLPITTDVNDFSVMSYIRSDKGEPTTYQLYDINELQDIYGANLSYNTEDTTYSLAETWSHLSLSPVETLWDAGGNDTLSAVGSVGNSIVDLRAGQKTSINGNGNISIAINTEIENAIGFDGNDQLFGNSLDNRLEGGNGNDYLYGNAGDDLVMGGAGDDIYEWGVGDDFDVINEEALAGRDTIRLTEFPTLDSLAGDLRFRLNGEDLVIDLRLDGGDLESSLTVTNQLRNAYRVETLELNGTRISLPNLTSQLAAGVDTFSLLISSDAFGQLVTPV